MNGLLLIAGARALVKHANRQVSCDVCGRFISLKDIESGTATVNLVFPDSESTEETLEALCSRHAHE